MYTPTYSDRQTIEDVAKFSPQLNGVSSFTLIVEAINTVDGSTFVVSSKEEEVLGVFHLVAQ